MSSFLQTQWRRLAPRSPLLILPFAAIAFSGCSTVSVSDLATTPAVERAADSVVLVRSGRFDSNGVVVSASGLVLTVSHGVGLGTTWVRLPNGSRLRAEVIYRDELRDMAVLQLPRNRSYPHLELASHHTLKESVVVLGKHRDEEGLTVETGTLVISGINMLQRARAGLQLHTDLEPKNPDQLWRIENGMLHTARIKLGFSGGPLLNLDGKLLGINTATGMYKDRSLTFAISAESYRPHLLHHLHRPHPRGDLPEVSAGSGNTQATEHDDLEGVRSPLIEGLWMVEGLDRLALATGLTPERVESLSKQVASDLHERSTQGDPAIRDLVTWVWKRYLAALEKEHRALKQE